MNKKIDLTGSQVGDLFVIREFKEKKYRAKYILECKCKCGRIFYPLKGNVLYKKTKNCKQCAASLNWEGRKIGNISVHRKILSEPGKGTVYECVYDCGHRSNIPHSLLKRLKGDTCRECIREKNLRKPKKLSRKEAVSITNYQKHLRALKSFIGRKIGNFTILSFSHWEQSKKRRYPIYNAKCDCKKHFQISGKSITFVKSCGCLLKLNHPTGENVPRAKFKNEEVRSIKELLMLKVYTKRELSKIYDVSEGIISAIKTGKSYKSIN